MLFRKTILIIVIAIFFGATFASASNKANITPNESGRIPILEYHHIDPKPSRWGRSVEQFRNDLLWLYNNDYVTLSLEDFGNNNFPIPAGKKPVIFTFDDGLISQFRYLDNGAIDPDCAVGIMDAFFEKHPDFGRAATFFVNDKPFDQVQLIKKKFEYLQKTGRQIGFHTLKHTNLGKLPFPAVKKILLEQAKSLSEKLPPEMRIDSLAYPFGGVPKNGIASIKTAEENGTSYNIKLALLVGAEPAKPLYLRGVDAMRIPRIQAIDSEFSRHFGRKAGIVAVQEKPEKFTVFVSNGQASLKKSANQKNHNVTEKSLENYTAGDAGLAPFFGIGLNHFITSVSSVSPTFRTFWQIADIYDEDAVKSFLIQNLHKFRKKPPAEVKGIYLTAYTAGSKDSEFLLEKLQKSGGTAVVVDFKETDGLLYYPTTIESIKQAGGNNHILFRDPKKFIETTHQKNMYVIARIVCFKDRFMASKRPEWTIRDINGNRLRSAESRSWLNPALPEVQNYILSIAKEAARFGVDEIQFDYVRFPAQGSVKFANNDSDGNTRENFEVIRDFLKKAGQEIELAATPLGIDVFGIVGWNKKSDETSTGQKIAELAAYVDVIYPMVYPSHYGPGFGGHKNPADEPYFFVKKNIELFQKLIAGNKAVLRPWLQGFTWRVSHFGSNYIKEQIRAVHDLGVNSFMIWNASNRYDAVWGTLEPGS